jgi:hypothetical protein
MKLAVSLVGGKFIRKVGQGIVVSIEAFDFLGTQTKVDAIPRNPSDYNFNQPLTGIVIPAN